MNLKKRTLFQRLVTLVLFVTVAVTVYGLELTDGKVYSLVNPGRNRAVSSSDACNIGQAMINTTNPHQLWLAVAGKGDQEGQFALRCLGNGLYLSSSEKVGGDWPMIPTIALDDFSFYYFIKESDNPETYIISNNKDGSGDMCMRLTGPSVVCGNKNHSESKWRISEVAGWTTEKIQEQLKKVAKFENDRTETYRALIYEKSLYKIFTDKACTILNDKYSKMEDSALENDTEYKKLPSVLRNTIKKIRKGNWEEANANSSKPGWDNENALKFRVQMYEPYSDPHQAGIAIKIQPHSVLNNPTGLYASKGDTIYVMVDNEIKAGSEIYFSSYQGFNRPVGNAQLGTKLKQGLNIITCNQDSTSYFVCYNVETFKNGKKTERRLSQYEDIKIHIEGGSINGYYNHVGDKLFKADKKENWDYYEQRANMPFITILGKYQVLQLYKDRMKSNDGRFYPGMAEILNDKVSVEDVIEAWDKLMFNQRLTLGILSKEEIEEARVKFPTLDDPSRGIYAYIGDDDVAPADYSDHYRVHGMSLGQLTGYMVGSNGYSGYNVSTFEAITVGLASKDHKNFGNIWGAAHEIGHQHQALIHMNGLKESSNNIFSNVAVWFDGKATSNMADGALENLLKVYNRKDGDFFHTTLGVQMILYYKLWLYYHLAGKNNKFYPRLFELLRQNPMNITVDQDGAQCLLHFYKMCCKASGEDLTEFFRAHCFFTPLKQRHVADYTSSDYTMTQEQVDAAIKEVKSWGYPLNKNIIFINDCAGKTVYSHDGKTARNIYNGKTNADLGMYTDFIRTEEGKVQGTYTYRFAEGKIVMSGAKGGVGFLAYDDEGMLQAFSDRYSFELSERARKKLSTHNLTFYVIDGAGNMTEIKSNDVVGEQRELLRKAIADAKEILKKVDDKNRRIGFFKTQAVEKLKALLTQAEKVYDDFQKDAYISNSYLLTEECNRIDKASDSRITFVPNSTYLLECQQTPNKFIYRESDNKLIMRDTETNASNWLFEMVGENTYYIKHAESGKYMSAADKSVMIKLVDKSQAPTYHLETLDDNYFAIGCSKGYLNYSNAGYVQGWAKIEGAHSKWRLLLVNVQESEQAYQDLAKSIEISETLVRKVADMKEITLQTTDENAEYHLFCNAAMKNNPTVNGSAANGYNLLDKKIDTYLHTETDNRINSTDGLNHYLRVYLKDRNLSVVSMNYTTRNADSQERPKAIAIEGSNDGQEYTPIMTISQGLPKHRSTEYITSFIDAGYKYIRLMVNATYGGKTSSNHPYFSMSSFGLTTPVLKEKYTTVGLDAILSEIKEAHKVIEAGRNQTSDKFKEAKAKLDAAYEKFMAECDAIDQKSMQNKKKELETLIAKTTDLINEVATVNYQENRNEATPVAVSMQCTNADGKAYISTNADHNHGSYKDGDGVAALLDNNTRTFLHTRYNGEAVNEYHHILVKLSDKPTNAEFDISYTTRDASGGPHPTEIVIETSADGNNFTEISRYTKDANALPQTAKTKWNTPKISPNGEYRYVRFVVPKSNNSKTHYGKQFFALSEFRLRTYEYKTDVNVSQKVNLSCVTDSLIIDLELSKVTAQSVADMADASESILDEQIAALKQICNAVVTAKDASAHYDNLKAYCENNNVPMRKLKYGTKVGQWQKESAEAYNNVFAIVGPLLVNKTGTANDYITALEDLRKAYNNLSVNLPEQGKLYTIRKSGDIADDLLCVDSENALGSCPAKENIQSNSIWQFITEGKAISIKSMHTGSFLTETTDESKLDANEYISFELKPLTDDGKIALVKSIEPLAEVPNGWYIEEVENPQAVGFDFNVNEIGYTELYLNYPVKIPAETEAYTISSLDQTTVILSKIASGIVPANTAVIIKARTGAYKATYTETFAPEERANMLRGSLYNDIVRGDISKLYYRLGVTNGNICLKKINLEYSENGTVADVDRNTDNGGYFKIMANKIYLPIDDNGEPETLNVKFEGAQSGIEDIVAEDGPTVIHDLQGRRLNKVIHSGFYIINGKKAFINTK